MKHFPCQCVHLQHHFEYSHRILLLWQHHNLFNQLPIPLTRILFIDQLFFGYLRMFWGKLSILHELTQEARLPCLSLSPGVCWNSCPLNQWYHPTNSSSIHPLLLSSVFPSVRVFSNESALSIRWPKYWSFIFSISLSNEYSGFISFRIDWFDLAVQGIFKSLLQHHSLKASVFQCSASFMVKFSHDYWKNYSFDHVDFCWQSDVSSF